MDYQNSPTVDDVLRMMSELPAYECALDNSCPKASQYALGHFDNLNDAHVIAQAISDGVTNEEDPWFRAAEGVVFDVYESGNKKCAIGDGGKSVGAWQMQGLAKNVACDPQREFPLWLGAVKRSESTCSGNPKNERLASLASGYCDKGLQLVRRRVNYAEYIVWKMQNN